VETSCHKWISLYTLSYTICFQSARSIFRDFYILLKNRVFKHAFPLSYSKYLTVIVKLRARESYFLSPATYTIRDSSKAATFRTIGRNGSDNLRANVDMRLSLSNSSMKRWFTPRADSRWLRVFVATRNLPCAAHLRKAAMVRGALTRKLASASSHRLVSGSAYRRARYYVGEMLKISNAHPYPPTSRSSRKTLVTVRWIVAISILNIILLLQLLQLVSLFPILLFFEVYNHCSTR